MRARFCSETSSRLLFSLLLLAAGGPAFSEIRWAEIREITPLEAVRPILYPAISHSQAVGPEGEPMNLVHVAYKENYVYYIRSFDNGGSWTQPVMVSERKLPNGQVDILAYGKCVHITYVSQIIDGEDEYFQVFHTFSDDYGHTFYPPRRVSQTRNWAYAPHLLRMSSGDIALLYYEVSSRTVALRRAVDIDLLRNMLESPISPVIRSEDEEILHTSLRLQVSNNDGRTFNPATSIREIGVPVSSFTAYVAGPGSSLCITYETDRGFLTLQSEDGGQTWTPNPSRNILFHRFELVNVADHEGLTYVTGIPHRPNKEVPVFFESTEEERSNITDPYLIQWPPDLVFGGGEAHLVFSAMIEKRPRLLYLRSDHSPPKSVLLWPRDPDVDTMEVRFQWTGMDDFSREDQLAFSYYLPDFADADWTEFGNTRSLVIRSPRDGVYKFMLRCKDETGNEEPTPVSFEFNTYNIAPETRITSRLRPTVNTRYVEVAWEGEDNNDRSEELLYCYRLNDELWSEFSRVTHRRFGPLLEGGHRIEARARDAKGNVDSTPDRVSFTVHLGMEVVFSSPPPVTTSEGQVEFNWRARDKTDDEAVFEFSAKLDDRPWGGFVQKPGTVLSNLTEGSHFLQVKARDSAGNESPVLQHSFVVDHTPPRFDFTQTEYLGLDSLTGYPQVRVAATDNYSAPENLKVYYRYAEDWHEAKLGEFSISNKISWWSPGYVIEIFVRDEVGNSTEQAYRIPLRLADRLMADKGQLFLVAGGAIVALVLLVVLIAFLLTHRGTARPIPLEGPGFTEREEIEEAEMIEEEEGEEEESDEELFD